MHPTQRILVRSILAFLTVSLPLIPQAAFAVPTINLISPKGGSSSGSPVFYEATATTTCAKGISSMTVYSAPGVVADTVPGAHIEDFLKLNPGSYSTVVQADDNCGGVAKTPVAIKVSSGAGVSVFLPNAASAYSPVHFAASAQNPACPAGIAAMRIYTSWGYTPYTVESGQLDAFVVLQASTYDATMQAWDNCGNVFKTNFQIASNGGDSDSRLYSTSEGGVISEFNVSSNGTLSNPNGSGNPPQFQSGTGGNTFSIDPGGQFAYTVAKNGVYGYQINPATGALTPAPYSPVTGLTDPNFAYAEPSGNFLFVISDNTLLNSFQIYRSTGYLSPTAAQTPGPTLTTLTTDPYGKYLYVGTNTGQVYGYSVNPVNGILTPVPGSPFGPAATNIFALQAAYQYLYVGEVTATGPQIYAYLIQPNSGYLTPVSGSPYAAPDNFIGSQAILADWLTRYLWMSAQAPGQGNGGNSFWFYDIYGYTGSMTGLSEISTGDTNVSYLAEGHAANVVYSAGITCGPLTCEPGKVNSWVVNGSGQLEHLSGPLPTGTPIATGIAVERANPQ
jgi:6-phosphogluconolactonase (cycloisomerase 2 family)